MPENKHYTFDELHAMAVAAREPKRVGAAVDDGSGSSSPSRVDQAVRGQAGLAPELRRQAAYAPDGEWVPLTFDRSTDVTAQGREARPTSRHHARNDAPFRNLYIDDTGLGLTPVPPSARGSANHSGIAQGEGPFDRYFSAPASASPSRRWSTIEDDASMKGDGAHADEEDSASRRPTHQHEWRQFGIDDDASVIDDGHRDPNEPSGREKRDAERHPEPREGDVPYPEVESPWKEVGPPPEGWDWDLIMLLDGTWVWRLVTNPTWRSRGYADPWAKRRGGPAGVDDPADDPDGEPPQEVPPPSDPPPEDPPGQPPVERPSCRCVGAELIPTPPRLKFVVHIAIGVTLERYELKEVDPWYLYAHVDGIPPSTLTIEASEPSDLLLFDGLSSSVKKLTACPGVAMFQLRLSESGRQRCFEAAKARYIEDGAGGPFTLMACSTEITVRANGEVCAVLPFAPELEVEFDCDLQLTRDEARSRQNSAVLIADVVLPESAVVRKPTEKELISGMNLGFGHGARAALTADVRLDADVHALHDHPDCCCVYLTNVRFEAELVVTVDEKHLPAFRQRLSDWAIHYVRNRVRFALADRYRTRVKEIASSLGLPFCLKGITADQCSQFAATMEASVKSALRSQRFNIPAHVKLIDVPSLPESRCGPDGTRWLAGEFQRAKQFYNIIGFANLSPPNIIGLAEEMGMVHLAAAAFGTAHSSMAWLNGLMGYKYWPPIADWSNLTEAARRECAVGDCTKTITVCGRCIQFSTIGNIVYGIAGRKLNVSWQTLLAGARLAKEMAPGAAFDPEDIDAYEFGYEVIAPKLLHELDLDVLEEELCRDFERAARAGSQMVFVEHIGGCSDCEHTVPVSHKGFYSRRQFTFATMRVLDPDAHRMFSDWRDHWWPE